jgi:hypothetical protein
MRRRENVPASGRPVYYDVTYRFRGEEHRMQTAIRLRDHHGQQPREPRAS